MTARFYKLTELHQKLDTALRAEIARKLPDQLKVMALKRRKLRVKDHLVRLTPSNVLATARG
ncbi:YdcH family protein [Aurantiacibacter sp. D1-12]|uniref:YdcH family protein n=1 Tax=Aurantiacibacter sp. D1-12 TaxID=2993658 RepID=UPI00237CB0FA|nr:YdcH family protein [Aurantiacibacter sp. D1-12]MDE1467330.1 YdcH family protein [Aurantiacibacter sp. D1-12]